MGGSGRFWPSRRITARRQFRLPEIRYQMMADLFLVFRVPRQISGKKLFFIHQPQYEARASGVPRRYSKALAYMGWRTSA
jgi:hypothetical protein